MTVNRQVGYFNDTTSAGKGAFVQFGSALSAGVTVCLVRVTMKLCFVPAGYTSSSQVETGAWAHAIQVGLGGVAPTAWNAAQEDPSILAFDSIDPDSTARSVWAPSTDTAQVAASLARTLEFRGQYHTTNQTEFYYRPYDITQALESFYTNFSWQVWWAT